MNRHASSSLPTVMMVVHAVTSCLCCMSQPPHMLFVVMLLPYMYATKLLRSRQAKLMAVVRLIATQTSMVALLMD